MAETQTIREQEIRTLQGKLEELRESVTEQDIAYVVLNCPTSWTTANRYMRGDVKKPALAKRILELLNKSISARKKVVEAQQS
jgi:hypothetical protein